MTRKLILVSALWIALVSLGSLAFDHVAASPEDEIIQASEAGETGSEEELSPPIYRWLWRTMCRNSRSR